MILCNTSRAKNFILPVNAFTTSIIIMNTTICSSIKISIINIAAAREKAACPCFAVAVRFEGGKRKEHIAGYTLLCLADFDHVPEERMAECLQLIRQDGHTLMAYTTMSGTGHTCHQPL